MKMIKTTNSPWVLPFNLHLYPPTLTHSSTVPQRQPCTLCPTIPPVRGRGNNNRIENKVRERIVEMVTVEKKSMNWVTRTLMMDTKTPTLRAGTWKKNGRMTTRGERM